MVRGVPGILAFNAGELSPLMDARVDQDKYSMGCKTLINFLCSVQGPAIRRGGTRFVATTKNNGKAWLSRFIFNRNQAYILEWGNNYVRFYTQRGQLQYQDDPYEISTPWTYDQLTTTDGTFALQFAQCADIMYITHMSGTYPVYKLSRLGATNWTLTTVDFKGGPFNSVDPNNKTITITPSGLGAVDIWGPTGAINITLTANSSIFDPNHVGSLLYLESIDYAGYTAWNTEKAWTSGVSCQYDGNVYVALNTATTGTVPPTHLEGIVSDGAVRWLYMHSGYGWVKITGYTSATQVSATILSRLPGAGGTVGQDGSTENVIAFTRYGFQSWNYADGYPAAVNFYKNRLAFSFSRKLIMSNSGAYEDFSQKTGFQVLDSNCINLTLGTKELNPIRWISGNRDLLCGTDSQEFSIQPQSANLVLSPSNIQHVPHTNVGTRFQEPIEYSNATLYVEFSGKRLREAKYDYTIDRYKSEDISILAEHIPAAGIYDICLQKDHDPVVWMPLGDGSLAGMTYNRDRNVIAWHRHYLGGYRDAAKTMPPFVYSAEAIPDPQSNRDDVWFVVERYINGNTVRYIEYLEDYKLLDSGQQFAFYVDCGLTYNGSPVTTITGLGHLEGQTVQILADGGVHPPRTVTGGQVTLDYSASVVHIGLPYTSKLQTMRLEFGVPDGTAQSRIKTIAECDFRFHNTVGGYVGSDFSKMYPIPFRSRTLPFGEVIPLFTGDIVVVLDADWSRDGFICVQQSDPLPMTLVSIYPRAIVND